MKKIYYQDSGYPIKRNLLSIPFHKYEPQKKIGANKVLTHFHYKLWGTNSFLSNSHWEFFRKQNGIWHFFNGVSFGKTPWIVTFETKVPRWHTEKKWLQEKGVKALASENCKKLIALSECAKKIQIRYLEEEFPAYKSQIVPKITVLHPPQKLLLNSWAEKQVSEDKLVFTLIGADFFRKGGKEVLFVFDRLLEAEQPVELNIVSTMQINDYASKAGSDELKKAKKIIKKHPKAIHHYNKLPNNKVLGLLKNSHVGLLPTWGDTYGYSVLEAQACGCPVITTDIRALPEINNDNCGWMINVPKDKWGNGVLDIPEDRTKFSDILREKLFEIMNAILSDPEQIEKKGRVSLKKIKEFHNPQKAAIQLEHIYDEIL